MGVCCTKDARPTGTSSSRHYVSVCTSPGPFPTDNEYRQESAVENAVEKASINTGVHPMWVEHHETPKHHHQRELKSLENVSQQRNRLTGSAKKRSDQSFTENDGGDSNKVVASKTRCAGAITRLKKRDSTRQPKYKDEIMLSDNIDSIVEKEIPEIPDEVAALAADIDSILSEDTPAAESRAASTSSSEVTPRPSARRRKKKKKHDKPVRDMENNLSDSGPRPDTARRNRKTENRKLVKAEDTEEGELASSPFAISSVSIPTLKKNLSQETMDEEDIRVEKEIRNMLKEDPFNGESSTPTPNDADEAPDARTEDATKQPTHMMTSEQEVEVDLNSPTTSSLSQMHSDSLATLDTKQHREKYPTTEKAIKEDEKLALDIAYILNDDVDTNESSPKSSSGAVSPKKKPQRPKESFTKEQMSKDDKELSKDIDVTTAELKFSSGIVSPTKTAQCPKTSPRKEQKRDTFNDKRNPVDDKLAKYTVSDDIGTDESKRHISSGSVSPTKMTQRPTTYSKETKKMVDEELAYDINYILKDDVGPADESNTHTSSRTISPTKEKKNAEDEKLAGNIVYSLNDDIATAESVANREIPSGTVSPTKKVQCSRKKYPARKSEHIDDNKLQTDVNRALKDDNPAIKSTSKSQISSGKASPRKKVSFQELDQEDDNLAKDIKYILEDDVGEDVPNAKNSLSLCKLPPPKKNSTRKHSKQADDQLAKDIAEILSDDIFAVQPDVPTSSNPSEIPRPKTSNPKLLLAMDMDRLFDPDSIVSSNHMEDKLEDDIKFILNDDLVDVASNARISFRSESAQRLKKQSVTETLKQTDAKLLKPKQTLHEKTVQGTSKERNSFGPREAPRPRKTIPTRKSRYVEEETTSKTSKSSPSPSSLPKSDFSSRSGSTQHPRTDSTRKIENMEDKALSKGTDHIAKEESTVESVRPISCTSTSLPRPKSRNPKRAFAMNTSKTQSSSPVASSSRAVQRPKQDYSRKPRHTTCTLAKDASVEGTSSGKAPSSASAVPRTNKDFTKKPEDTLILEELDSNMEIGSSSCVVPQSSKDPTREQNRATKHSSNQPGKTEDADLDEICNAILDIPIVDYGASVKAPSSSKRQSVSTGNGILVKDVQKLRTQTDRKTAVLKQGSLTTNRKAPAHVSSGYSPSTSPGIFYETGELTLMEQIQKESAQAIDDTGVPNMESPDSRASSSSITTTNCDSGCSVVSGDTMRPMAAGSSRIASMGCSAFSGTVKLPTSDTTKNQLSKRRQTLPAILKDENTVRKPRMKASRETAVPFHASQQSMATHRTTAVPVTSGSKPRAVPGIVYESEELKLMEQIERESRRQ